MKVSVIGASHAGMATIQNLVANNTKVEIDWFEKHSLNQTMRFTEKDLIEKKEWLKKNNVKINENTQIASINAVENLINTADGEQYTYDKLILATGSVPNLPNIDGIDLPGIMTLSNPIEIARARRLATEDKIKNVVVIGGGYIGVGVAELFNQGKKNTTLIDTNSLPLEKYLDSEITTFLQKQFTDNGIKLEMNSRVSSFIEKNGVVSAVKTDHTEYSADLVVLAIGIKPETSWLKDVLKLTPDGYIETNEYMQTSVSNIYAVGDNTFVPYSITDTRNSIALASNARLQAAIVAQNVVQNTKEMPAVQGTSSWQSFGFNYGSTGINSSLATKYNIVTKSVVVNQTIMTPQGPTPVIFKLMYTPKDLRVMGAQILGAENLTANINIISLAINQKLTLTDLAYQDFYFYLQSGNESNFIDVAARNALRQEGLL